MIRTLIVSFFVVVISTGFYLTQKTAPPAKPNIIYLLTDDQRADALGIMGNPLIKTPNLDQLARQGTLFKNAYVTTSICCVSRATMLSGQYMSRHGIEDFNTSFKPEALAQTYPMLLKKAGYRIGFVGKYGVGAPKDQPQSAFDFWACTNKSQPDYEMKDENGNDIHNTDQVNKDILKFIDGSTDQPFCLSVSFKAPHVQDNDPRQFIIQPRYKPMYAADSIAESPKADPKYWNSFPDFFRTEQNIARERWHLRFENNRMYQESVRNYYRLISGVDEVVGNLVKKLEEKGLADNTVIIFMGDNGFYLGEYGLAGKWYGHEESIRVPLIVYDPRNAKIKGKKEENIALNIDIAPTILQLAGLEIPAQMQGIDLVKEVSAPKKSKANRQEFFYEHTFMGSPKIPKVEGIVQPPFKYMTYTEHGYEELFDLKKDPSETKNVVADPAYKTRLATMRTKYAAWKQQVQ
ncbi:sulfatase family protein [Arundinibacter roseus]|uniref:DUF4976 domain-containing protein n=1 Tax=Arundinibacter roseus TaxID=2070510 RepID=A0A4R4KIB4_9BACT|nr:sulfatase [Arundinibacter roseus]TDB67897.1 DUF4976 domain-containing protein [Arundinibacter roseus]